MVDACMLGSTDSTFLQQATHLTGGIYMRPKQRSALLQYLLVGLPPPVTMLVILMLPIIRQHADSRRGPHVMLMQPSYSSSNRTRLSSKAARPWASRL